MGRSFETNQMNVPAPKPLPGQNEPTPHVIIGDEAFGLKPYVMRPFPYRQSKTDVRKLHYNMRLCLARRVVENAFGILARKWRIFYRPLETKLKTSIAIVKAACVLHYMMRTVHHEDNYLQFLEPPEDEIRAFVTMNNDPRRSLDSAFRIRQNFENYFN